MCVLLHSLSLFFLPVAIVQYIHALKHVNLLLSIPHNIVPTTACILYYGERPTDQQMVDPIILFLQQSLHRRQILISSPSRKNIPQTILKLLLLESIKNILIHILQRFDFAPPQQSWSRFLSTRDRSKYSAVNIPRDCPSFGSS